jgi:hypothetical protein
MSFAQARMLLEEPFADAATVAQATRVVLSRCTYQQRRILSTLHPAARDYAAFAIGHDADPAAVLADVGGYHA